jgi:hypothetical protein
MGQVSITANPRNRFNRVAGSADLPPEPPGDSLSDQILALSPDVYLKLDEPSGTFADSSGNSRVGTGTNITYQGKTGPDGNYAEFVRASGSYVTIGDFPGATPPCTIFMLVRPDSLDANMLVAKGLDGAYSGIEWTIVGQADGSIIAATHQTRGPYVRDEETSTGALVVGEWHAFGFTLTGTAPSSDIVVDKDGSGLSTTATPGSGSVGNYSKPFHIGNRLDVGGFAFDGGMAHFAFFAGVVDLSSIFTAFADEGW